MSPLGKRESGKKINIFPKGSEPHEHSELVYGKWGPKGPRYSLLKILKINFESFSKAKYEERTEYQRTTVVELRIFSAKSTLLVVWRPFQTSDRVRNTFKFCHSLSRYRCYMLTLQALTYSEDPEYELAGPLGTMPQEPWHPNRARCNAKPVPWSSSHTGKCAPLQVEKQLEQWRASTTERNNSLHKDELSRVNLFTIALLGDFNFVLVRCILRFLFLKIRFGDITG